MWGAGEVACARLTGGHTRTAATLSHSLSLQPQLHTTLPPLPFKVSLEALEGVCAWFGGGAGEVRGHPDKRAREKS